MNASEETVELGKQVVVVLYQLLENGTAQYAFEVQMRWWDEITAVRNMIRHFSGIDCHSLLRKEDFRQNRALPTGCEEQPDSFGFLLPFLPKRQ
mgnify:CR=1 FL=1